LISNYLFFRCYGGGQSLNAWQRGRISLSFETKEAAKLRREKILDDQIPAKKIKKDHTGNVDTMNWDRENLKEEVEGFADDYLINYSELARQYNVCNSAGQLASNGGQIVKEWLISEGVDLSRFKTNRNNDSEPVIRRRKRKGPGGEISIPTEITREMLKQKLKERIESGEYTVGEMIVPQKVRTFNTLTGY